MKTPVQTQSDPASVGHTQGPWNLTFSEWKNGVEHLAAFTDASGHEWMRVTQQMIGRDGRSIPENARLIAAAPDLLAALRKISDADYGTDTPKRRETARLAIARNWETAPVTPAS